MQHYRQVLSSIDTRPLLAQIAEHPELWNVDNAWTTGKSLLYAVDNIVLRYNKSTQTGLNDWDRHAFNVLSTAQPIILDLMRAVPGEHLGKVMISRLPPGGRIDWHVDYWTAGQLPYYQRYQIPLSVSDAVRFCVGGDTLHMKPGTAWHFNNQMPHAVFNDSDEERLSMFADIRPFHPETAVVNSHTA